MVSICVNTKTWPGRIIESSIIIDVPFVGVIGEYESTDWKAPRRFRLQPLVFISLMSGLC